MSSAVDFCNLAFSHIGHRANVASISPPEATYEAQLCARFYPMARNEALELHNWGLATTRRALAELTDAAPESWEYAYAIPNDCMKILSVLDEGATDDSPTAAYICEGDMLFTNIADATLRYVAVETDTTKYSPLLGSTIALMLASYLAGPIVKGKEGIALGERLANRARSMHGMAASSDANSERTNTYRDQVGANVAARA